MRPYIRKLPKPFPQNVFTLSAFGGGLNNVNGDTTIEDNQATDCKNMMFISDEIMEKRCGTSAIDDFVLDGAITWIDMYRPTTGEPQMIRATDSEVYCGETKICDVNGRIKGANYIGKYYFVDGKHLYVYDGTTYYQICNTNSYTTKEVAANGKDFFVKQIPDYVTVDNPLYFLVGTTKVTLDITAIDRENNKITVASGHTAKVPKDTVVYFFTPLGSSHLEGTEVWDAVNHYAYYEPCENQLNDEFAGTQYIPDKPDTLIIHKDRVFIAGDSEQPHGIYMSALASISPIYFPVGASLSAKPDGQKIVDFVVFDNALIVGRHTDIFVIYGSSEYQNISSDPFYIRQMDSSTGFMSANCGALLNNFFFYLGYDGRFYKLNTPTTFVEYLMTRPLTDVVDLYSPPLNLTKEDMSNISTIAYNNECIFNIKDKTLVYSYRNQAFTYYEGWNGRSLYTDGIDVFIGRADGVTAKVDPTVYSDLGKAIEAVYETKRFDLNSPINYKYFIQCLLSAHAYDDYVSSIMFQVEVDFYYKNNAPIIYNKHKINANLSNFNVTAPEKLSSAKNIIKSEWIKLNYRGRTIKFKFSNDMLDEPMRVYDINMIYTVRDVR
ncbi:MAG TPA: hypothetical protein PK033_15415 [Acetivibrio sp.]|nr:hypothetical protein [Acetivibrio sp.]